MSENNPIGHDMAAKWKSLFVASQTIIEALEHRNERLLLRTAQMQEDNTALLEALAGVLRAGDHTRNRDCPACQAVAVAEKLLYQIASAATEEGNV